MNMRKQLTIALIAFTLTATPSLTAQEADTQPEAAAMPSTSAQPVADGGESEDLPYVEPETVAEPTLRLDEPSAPKTSSLTAVNVALALLSLCGLIAAAWALLEVKRIKRRLAALEEKADEDLPTPTVNNPSTGHSAAEPQVIASQPVVRRPRPAVPAPAETPRAAVQQQVSLFLSRPDEDDCFARATAAFEPGNSIFILTSDDGVNGSFTVINDPDVHRLALMMPTQNLTRACSGNAIQLSAGKSRIVTDRAGKAVRDADGRWQITLKAIIHYE